MVNKRHDKGTFTMEDGGTYVGTTKDGVPHGQGTYTWTSGEKYVGKWKDGKQHGQGTLTKSDGKKHVGKWKDGELHGKGTHKEISVSKESVGRGAKSLSNIVAIVFGLTTGVPFGFMVAGSGGWSGFATIVVIIICFFVVYYFWKFVFWGLRSLISEFFN
ncbi:MAG: hypothetical protein HVK27_05960 [Pelagibacteraceae bacterium]|jgi:hypothetical protein|nr:hypothetical protein [Pelagibacteraceae bacterium]